MAVSIKMLGLVAIIAIIIVIIMVVIYSSTKPTFKREDKMSYVNGKVSPGKDSADGKVKYLGTTSNRDLCEDKCAATSGCKGYTWHNNQNGSYSDQCFGLTAEIEKSNTAGETHMSGYIM